MKKVEILAPAGDKEGFLVALNSGADAIYLGMKSFSARSSAKNFDVDTLKECVERAHLLGVKVYLTVNTIVKEEEISEFLECVKSALKCNVDAFIVQDVGMATLLKDNFENICLHASTQMAVHNLWGALALEKMGFQRVVLSRETRLEDIRLIKENTNLEIEFFVQGALCVCFSGNCYLSSVEFSKSGNRGECLQLCRLNCCSYLDNKKISSGRLLSPKDLCLLSKIGELADAGVCSFKIEGRLKRPSYVSQAIESFKKVLQKNSLVKSEMDKLTKVFNRGEFNQGEYLQGVGFSNIINKEFSNHRGVKVGKVLKVVPFKDIFKIEISSNCQINKGDGLKFVKDGKEQSLGVGDPKKINNNYVIYSKCKPQINAEVYRILDKKFEDKLVAKNRLNKVKIKVTAIFQKPFKIEMSCKGITVEHKSDYICEKAKSQNVIGIITNACKLNSSIFEAEEYFENKESVFVPKSVINETRRQCLEKLRKEILKEWKTIVKTKDIVLKESKPISKTFYQISKDFCESEGNENLVFVPNFFTHEHILKDLKVLGVENQFVYLFLPPFATGEECELIKKELNLLGREKFGIVINNLWALKLLEDGFKGVGGYMLNIANTQTSAFYERAGLKCFFENIEPNFSVKNASVYNGEKYLMTLLHCVYKLNLNQTCHNCNYDEQKQLKYKMENQKEYKIKRCKVKNCCFYLYKD